MAFLPSMERLRRMRAQDRGSSKACRAQTHGDSGLCSAFESIPTSFGRRTVPDEVTEDRSRNQDRKVNII